MCKVHKTTICATLCVISIVLKNANADCVRKATKESELKEPIYLRSNSNSSYSFLLPTKEGAISLKDGEKIVFACPNSKNFIIGSDSNNSSVGVCTKGKIKVANSLYEIESLQCNKSLRGEIKMTSRRCGNDGGSLVQIGFNVGRSFLHLFEVCHNFDEGYTIYSRHQILGKWISKASKSSARPGFSTLGLSVSASVAYKRPYLKGQFSSLLGSSLLADNYISNKSYLSRGHLSPDADFLFAPWQFATYFYINVCPQWQTINAGNWRRVEAAIRRLAAETGEDLEVVTGTHAVLALRDGGGRLRPMYLLPGDKLPIPKYLWKVVYLARKRQAVVIVIANNPFAERQRDFLCPTNNVCADNGWHDDNWHRTDKGMVHCCEYKEFARSVRTVPTLSVAGVLKGPKRS